MSLPAPSTVLQAAIAIAAAAIPSIDSTATSFLAMVKAPSLAESTHVDEMTGDGGGGRHCRTHEMGAAARTLAALEVAIRGRRAALARAEPVFVHAEAHRAA